MPKIIKRIYELSWDMFGDLPRGHHKNNSMHKLASKTMIEILPPTLADYVEKKCGSLAGKNNCDLKPNILTIHLFRNP